jgi:cell division topological specificity factor
MALIDSFLGSKKIKPAHIAKERLQIILALQRSSGSSISPNYLSNLQDELVAVVSKYVKVDLSNITVTIERQDGLEVLEVKVELPETQSIKIG